jgi:hypothetical protein
VRGRAAGEVWLTLAIIARGESGIAGKACDNDFSLPSRARIGLAKLPGL